MHIIPESKAQAKTLRRQRNCSEHLAKHFAGVRPWVSRRHGRKKFHKTFLHIAHSAQMKIVHCWASGVGPGGPIVSTKVTCKIPKLWGSLRGVWIKGPWICPFSESLASESLPSESLSSESLVSESLALESLAWGESQCGFSLPSEPLPSESQFRNP